MAIHLLFSERARSLVNVTNLLLLFESFIANINDYTNNPEFITIVINELHLCDDRIQEGSTYFLSLLRNGNLRIRRQCLTRIQGTLTEKADNEEFVMWCLPLVVSCIGQNPTLTFLSCSILESVIALGSYTDLVVSALSISRDKIHFLVENPLFSDLVMECISTDTGFSLFEEEFHFVSRLLDSFMVIFISCLLILLRARGSTITFSI